MVAFLSSGVVCIAENLCDGKIRSERCSVVTGAAASRSDLVVPGVASGHASLPGRSKPVSQLLCVRVALPAASRRGARAANVDEVQE